MRIIAGRFRGRRLAPAPRRGVRPTADPVREALFNILGPRTPDRPFVDLCAGTGAVGLEALSRGARPVLLVERSRAALRVIEANVDRLGLPREGSELRVVSGEVSRWLATVDPSGLAGATVYLDPPYGDPATVRLVEAILASGLLGSDGLLVVEHAAGPAPRPGALWTRRYGDSALTGYALQPPGS